MDKKTQAALDRMLAKYNDLKNQGWKHMAAAHAVTSNSRNRQAVAAFFQHPDVVAAGKAYMATVKI